MVRPVILATFANDRYGPTSGYLRDLVGERRAIEAAWRPLSVEVVSRGNITLDELFDLFTRYQERVVVWHHGGHAEADALFLETPAGEPARARVEGLASRLGRLPALELIALNGCSTQGHVAALRAHCHSPIVATTRAIADEAARRFATALHGELAADRSIAEAFANAASRVEAGVDGPSRLLRPGHGGVEGPPWWLHVDPEHPDSAEWRVSHGVRGSRRWRTVVFGLALLLVIGAAGASWSVFDRGAPPGTTCVPADEMCDGSDNDCDGTVDESAGCTLPGGVTRCGPERAGQPPAPPCNGCPDGVEVPAGWVCIPPGETDLGAPEGIGSPRPSDLPHRRVVFDRPFLMMATEMTRRSFAAIAATTPALLPCAGDDPDNCPVDHVSWLDAVWFANRASAAEGRPMCYSEDFVEACAGAPFGAPCPGEQWCILGCDGWLHERVPRASLDCSGYRLPTVDEWGYAARAGAASDPFPGGASQVLQSAWVGANAGRKVHPVGGLKPNAWGLYDMVGNVAEPVEGAPPLPRRGVVAFVGGDIYLQRLDVHLYRAPRDPPSVRRPPYGLRLVRSLPDRSWPGEGGQPGK